MNTKLIPKIELHNHLDGSVPIKTIKKFADKAGMNLTLDEVADLAQSSGAKSLNDYLAAFDFSIQFLQTAPNLEEATYDVIMNSYNNGVVYLELRFAPLKHLTAGLTPDEVIESVIKGVKRASKDFPIIVKLIVIAMRDMSVDDAIVTFKAGLKYRDHVVGCDLAGNEADFPPELFEKAFSYAQNNDLPITIHAGEAGPAKNILTSIRMGAKRIGHGVQGQNDQEVLQRAKANKIAMELCLKSNFDTKAITDLSKSPFLFYYQNGVRVSINSDDETVSATNEQLEYQRFADSYKLDLADFYRIDQMAISAAFCSDDIKKQIKMTVDEQFKLLGFSE